ncbi:MAG: lipid A export permease/ATP-binding protein MsbA [Gammaproteobacteria bacterium]|nr:lipid A export permease/ATP-binding protein MsbA [Gammaproteobacteria bacterium]MBU6509546.1 lipid A export permease/ATP-binding protein MsbA [Gammaproteobacteria bacterium]MDE1983834.1 lipid A export permease/ATP-binding protein MsbA [Gammaproteobacteria bacterium]MDE2108520.1 lipid A export permease/ATP-binding protein MsbA [Gammaproteobacteria bacterium]MDE2459982.1 lipid A export permease/ATP-binding protein MsbA [Gammaproteobacteria bacterium]
MRFLRLDRGVLKVYRRLLGYAVPFWRVFALAIFGMVIYALTQPAFAALVKPLLDKSFVQHNTHSIKLIPVLVVGLFVLRGVAGFFATYFISWVGRSVIKRLRGEAFGKLLHLPTRYYDATSSGMLVSKITYNIEQVAEATTNAITVLIRDGLTILGLVGLMFYLSWVLSVFILVVGPLIALLVRFVSDRFRRYSGRIQDSMGDVTRVSEEVIAGHRVVKLYGGSEQETAKFERVNEHNRYLNMKLVLVNAGSSPIIQLIAGIGMALVIYIATLPSVLPMISVGTFGSFLSAMLLLMAPLKHLTDINAPLQKGIAAGQSIFELLDEESETAGGSRALTQVRGQLEFRALRFAYSAAKGEVLKDISFTVAAGETVALVGRSGSGKSTLVSLVARFYDPGSGAILLDGHDVRDYPLHDLREQIALVSQEVLLFNDSIRNNIAYGSLARHTQAEVAAAADAAHVMEFVCQLPQGLDTLVGDRGVLLSGGQRQRIAIARALLKNAPLLILDEATSSLDSESERHIQAALEQLMHARTTLVIAHRLSTVERADRIMVLDQGRVVETGRHQDLLQRNGHYARLYHLQFRDAAVA